jgi:hypothetical protein
MEIELLIALVVGGVGAALALLGIILAVMARVSTTRAVQEMQSQQQETVQSQSAQWLQDQEMENMIKLRLAFLDCIQKIKDEVNILLRVKKGETKKDKINKALSDHGRILSKLCDERAEQLMDVEREAMLRAKDTAVEATFRSRSFLDEVTDPSDLSSAHRVELMQIRDELGDAQSVLRGLIQDRLIKRVFRDGREG